MRLFADKNDSDSNQSPIDDKERVVGVEQGAFETLGHGELPADPDAGLSEEEKAHIVCVQFEPDRTGSRLRCCCM